MHWYNTFCAMILYARAQSYILISSLSRLEGFTVDVKASSLISLNDVDDLQDTPFENKAKFIVGEIDTDVTDESSAVGATVYSLKDCAYLHAYVIELVNDINSVFGDALILEIIMSSVQSCMVLFQCSKASLGDAKVITLITLLLCTTVMPLSICWCGQIVRNIGEEIRERIYEVDWYRVPPNERKVILPFQIQANKVMSLNARGMFHMDIATFMVTLQTAYSYFTLLSAMDT